MVYGLYGWRWIDSGEESAEVETRGNPRGRMNIDTVLVTNGLCFCEVMKKNWNWKNDQIAVA